MADRDAALSRLDLFDDAEHDECRQILGLSVLGRTPFQDPEIHAFHFEKFFEHGVGVFHMTFERGFARIPERDRPSVTLNDEARGLERRTCREASRRAPD